MIKEVGQRDQDSSLATEELLSQKKEQAVSLADKLIEEAEEVVDSILIEDVDLKGLKTILLLRHPVLGISPTGEECKQFLCDLPYYILAVHSQFLRSKFDRETFKEELERNEYELTLKIEDKIRGERLVEREQGLRKEIGQITSSQLESRASQYPEYETIIEMKKKLREMEYREKMMEKVVSVLENRRYELRTIVDIELKTSY
jgi:hypothetical protein